MSHDEQRQRELETLAFLQKLHAKDEHFVEEAQQKHEMLEKEDDAAFAEVEIDNIARVNAIRNSRFYNVIMKDFLTRSLPIAIIAAKLNISEKMVKDIIRVTNEPCHICHKSFVASVTMKTVDGTDVPLCKEHRSDIDFPKGRRGRPRRKLEIERYLPMTDQEYKEWMSKKRDYETAKAELHNEEVPEIIKAPKPVTSIYERLIGSSMEELENKYKKPDNKEGSGQQGSIGGAPAPQVPEK